MTQKTLRWKSFPFSLIDRVDQWHTCMVGHLNKLGELRDNFYHLFFLDERIESLPHDFLDFEQLEGESIGAAWVRFLCLLTSTLDMSIRYGGAATLEIARLEP